VFIRVGVLDKIRQYPLKEKARAGEIVSSSAFKRVGKYFFFNYPNKTHVIFPNSKRAKRTNNRNKITEKRGSGSEAVTTRSSIKDFVNSVANVSSKAL
jgi:hypothetical protein